MSENFVESRGFLRLGDRYMKEGNFEKAIHCYEQALESCPADALRHYEIISQRLVQAVAKCEKPEQKMSSQSTKPQARTRDTVTPTRYYANAVTNREIPAGMCPGFSQGLWEQLKKEEPALGKNLITDVSHRTPCEFEFSPISCRDDMFIDTAKQVLAQWVRDMTKSMNVPIHGPFVSAGSVQVEWPSEGTKMIKYAVSLLAFGPEMATESKKWWQLWK